MGLILALISRRVAWDIPEITIRCGVLPYPPFPLEFHLDDQKIPAKSAPENTNKPKVQEIDFRFGCGFGFFF